MLHDLAHETPPSEDLQTQVAIIGGGIAGLFLANKLTDRGIPCLVLESGGEEEITDDPLYRAVDYKSRTYTGASEGRSRCLGGTSVKWGGALAPFRPQDFEARPNLGHPGWPIGPEDLQPYLETVEETFGLNHSPYETEACTGRPNYRNSSDFLPREAKWPSFKKRNVAQLFTFKIKSPSGLQVWLNATVREFDTDSGSIGRLTAFGPKGQKLRVRAKHFVLASGAIESTRLLLLLDRQTDGCMLTGRNHLGYYFQDHLSAPLASIKTTTPRRLNQFAGFRFEGATMRSLRFERDSRSDAAGFIHIAPRTPGSSGFDAIRDLMRALQARRLDLAAIMRVMRHSPYIGRLLWWRLAKRRLLWPSSSEYDLHVVLEQTAVRENRISLGERLDSYGHPVTVIDWDISADDLVNFQNMCQAFDAWWHAQGLTRFGTLCWQSDNGPRGSDLDNVLGIYHPVGTTRMSSNPSGGVVDENLAVFGLRNMYVAATSALPNGGTANPTMTLLMLTLRLADHLSNRVRRCSQVFPPIVQSNFGRR